ncbi:hypothetical protein P0136_01835 [Lentisphaerota bacterium ZTH]|nr:hypothetical protein JYG24_07025 [Lentisphaerota bacterium]WET06753.1 hypothetical protein P0136_01835 [Lentisphaerota bacterium ZTH]
MSVFEAVMMICFGASWPLAIFKTYKSKNPAGKSLAFMALLLVGYASGIVHKIVSGVDLVLCLYILNFCMVATDLWLTAYYLRKNRTI